VLAKEVQLVAAGGVESITIAAGLVTLTTPDRWRWNGLALLLFLAALGPAPLCSAATWLALAAAIPWLASTSTSTDRHTTVTPR
jgi:hypothetical protein